ncbi:unnamed protein product [Prorocentrum cordatum]|uniref:Uncharacterized protein n=1 Tax=Prorocentrum cordatum TaxID=2364126 RepID=A0ABN9RG90_9DINO|nr:unnamed protein product [Polarella glacialis]
MPASGRLEDRSERSASDSVPLDSVSLVLSLVASLAANSTPGSSSAVSAPARGWPDVPLPGRGSETRVTSLCSSGRSRAHGARDPGSLSPSGLRHPPGPRAPKPSAAPPRPADDLPSTEHWSPKPAQGFPRATLGGTNRYRCRCSPDLSWGAC